jgi:hypothetical protein
MKVNRSVIKSTLLKEVIAWVLKIIFFIFVYFVVD